MKRVNPLHIPKEDLPLIVLMNDNNLFSRLIRWWQYTKWPHGAIMIRKDFFACQGTTYRELRVEKFYKSQLKFRKPDFTKKEKKDFISHIKKDLKDKKKYDFLGIIGQMFKIRWLNNPNKYYCWEAVTVPLRFVGFKVPLRPRNLDKALSRHGKIGVYGTYKPEGDKK